MNEHQSEHPVGTRLDLTWKRTKTKRYVAVLHRRVPNGEEWRIIHVSPYGSESYLMSEGWKWVSCNI